MKTTIITRTMIAAASTLLLVACGSNGGFESLSSQNSTQDNTNQQTPPPSGPSEFQKLDMSAFVGGTSYENEQVVALDKPNNMLILSLPLPPGPFNSVYIDIPNVKGVKLATTLDSQQKARLSVSIPLKLIFKDKVSLPTANKLPDGRDLPMMPSGEFPSLGVGIHPSSDNKIYLYFGVDAVGLFLESSYFPEYIGITVPIKNKSGTRTLGYFTIVPKAGVNKGGLFLSFRLPKDIATIIDNHLSGVIN